MLFNDPDGLMAALAWNNVKNAWSGAAQSFNDKLGATEWYAPPVSYQSFVNNIQGKSLLEVQNEGGSPGINFESFKSAYAGPNLEYRYVRDPGNSNAVIDMRHFLVVGQRGHLYGLAIEMLQLSEDSKSAFSIQDFYSNELGVQFFRGYDSAQPLAPQVDTFFKSRQK